jgi:hypothetical protein
MRLKLNNSDGGAGAGLQRQLTSNEQCFQRGVRTSNGGDPCRIRSFHSIRLERDSDRERIS